MAQTYFGSALRAGSSAVTDGIDGGFLPCMQTGVLVAPSTATSSNISFTIPAGAQITNITIDRIVQQAGGTGTTLLMVGGTTAGGTQYFPSTDLFTAVRAAPTFTVAQVAAMGNVGTTQTVVFQVTANGTATTAAQFRINLEYAQKL